MNNKKIKAVVYIPPDTYAELEQKAIKLGTSVATVILELIAKNKKNNLGKSAHE